MKGDFTRNTFNPANQFTRVLLQQGRVQLDADWNEQTSILLHYLWALATDLIGPFGGPEGDGFRILEPSNGNSPDFKIGNGRYYVAGRLCENDADELHYTDQTHLLESDLDDNGSYLVYLNVWERHVSHLETDSLIREVALGGPDTATRAQLVWQVSSTDGFIEVVDNEGQEEIRGIPVSPDLTREDVLDRWEAWVRWRGGNLNERGTLQARAGEAQTDLTACVIPPGSRYRGLENQLYRVEIHRGSDPDGDPLPTFKFSRDNGSVMFPLVQAATQPATSGEMILWLEHLGRDERFGLQRGDWVEVVDDDYTLQNRAGRLLEVIELDPIDRTVTLKGSPADDVGEDMARHPFLRRWDHRAGNEAEGGLTLNDGAAEIRVDAWLKLEDGIQIRFPAGGVYHTGDYWLIPARTVTGDIEWPQKSDGSGPRTVPPHGVSHYYAPLAIINFAGGNLPEGNIIDCRRKFSALAE